MDTQKKQKEKFDIGELDITKTDYMKIQEALAKPPENTGGVTQVNADEFEAYSQEVKSFVVNPANGLLPPQNILMGQMLMGGHL